MFGADSSARVPRRDPRGLDVAARRRPKMQSSTGTRIAADASNFDCNRATLRCGSSEIRLLASQHLPLNGLAMLRRTKLQCGAPWSAPHEPQETPPGSLSLSEWSPSPSNRDGKIQREWCHGRPCAKHFVARGATKRLSYNAPARTASRRHDSSADA